MAFPRKFKELLETELDDVNVPDYLMLTYAVCGCFSDSCGWAGWIIEGALQKTKERYSTGTGGKLLPADYEQRCPKCGKSTFRTGASIVMEPTPNPSKYKSLLAMEFKSDPMTYED